jgi:hypothetical protein
MFCAAELHLSRRDGGPGNVPDQQVLRGSSRSEPGCVLLACSTNGSFAGARYYGGNEYIDQIETLAIKRALTAFHLEEKEWGVNVQPYSGARARFQPASCRSACSGCH